MAIRRIQRKTERAPEELASLRAVRDEFQRDKPGPDEVAAGGDYEGPFHHGDVMALLDFIGQLKRERELQGLSLGDLSSRSGMNKTMISQLENGKILNPTWATLFNYASGLGIRLMVHPRTLPAPQGK